jgi:thiol-disulfide isomerase/thioredoxin
VLLHFWATWGESCKADMPALKELLSKYSKAGFKVIGVSLDNKAQDVTAYLAENSLPWPQVYEEGGLDSRPANQLGILTVPTMILVDQDGKVINRAIRAPEIEPQLKKLLR